MKIELTPDLEKMVRDKVDAGAGQRKLERLRNAIARGQADVRAGRTIVLETRGDLEVFFRGGL